MYSNLGLKLIDSFITEDQETNIISNIEDFRKNNPKLVANYGDFNLNSIYFGERYKKQSIPIPDYLLELSHLLINAGFFTAIPFGIAINTYNKGQKIGAHIDKIISGPLVTILSLNSSATMIFKKNKQNNISLELHPRSVIQMKDEIRNEWTHEILPVKKLRYSIVFRSLC